VNLFLSILAAALYGIACARLFFSLTRTLPLQPATAAIKLTNSVGNEATGLHQSNNRRLTLSMAGVAGFLHLLIVFSQTGLPGNLQLPFFAALSVAALVIVLLQLLLCLRHSADYLGLAAYPLAAVTLLASLSSANNLVEPIQDQAIQLHVLLSIVAYAVLALAASQAVLAAVQRHFLNAHKPGGFMRALPPFETTENLLFVLLQAGFTLLTLSLASGFFYLENMFSQHLAHKTLLSCVAWILFGTLIYGRWRYGWRGRRAVQWTLVGFGVLILAYFGSKLVLELILQRS